MLFGSVPGASGFGLAFDSVGNLYAADGDDQTIYKFAPDGTRTVFVGPSAFAAIALPSAWPSTAQAISSCPPKAIRETTLFSSSLPTAWRALSLPV